jgi:hypothetical protein
LVSMAAKAKSRTNAARGGDGPIYQPFVKIRLDEGPSFRGSRFACPGISH